MDDASLYNGKRFDLRPKMAEIVEGMKTSENFAGLISIPRFYAALDVSHLPKTQTLTEFLAKNKGPAAPMERVAFHDPFLVSYSSGTTGVSKCIVHSVGGVLLNYTKESRLHEDCGPKDVALQFTTLSWIMYCVAFCQLLTGSRTVLYDGSPFQPDPQTFIKLVGDQKVTKLGVSPRWMTTVAEAGISPREITDLSHLRVVTSTGMVLPNDQFEWFYDKAFPAHTKLVNISGGTDIVSDLSNELHAKKLRCPRH